MVITGHQSTEEQGFIRNQVFSEKVNALTYSVAFWIELGLETDVPVRKIHSRNKEIIQVSSLKLIWLHYKRTKKCQGMEMWLMN